MTDQSTSSAIRKVNDDFEHAMNTSNVDALTDIYTSDGQLLPQDSPIVAGKADISAFWHGVMEGIANAKLETLELEIHGDTAIEVGAYTLQTANSDVEHGKYIVIWKRIDGEWKYHRDMWSKSNLVQGQVAAGG